MAKKRQNRLPQLRWGPVAALVDVCNGWIADVRDAVASAAVFAATTAEINLPNELCKIRIRRQPAFGAATGALLRRAHDCSVLDEMSPLLDALLGALLAFTRTAGLGTTELVKEGAAHWGGENPYILAEHQSRALLDAIGRFELLLRRNEDRDPLTPIEQLIWSRLEFRGMTEPQLELALNRAEKQRYLSRVCARMTAKGYEIRNTEQIGYWRPDAPPGARPPPT